MGIFNQSGQTVGKQTNVGYTKVEVELMIRYALRRAAQLVPDENRDSIRAGTADIIKDMWKLND